VSDAALPEEALEAFERSQALDARQAQRNLGS